MTQALDAAIHALARPQVLLPLGVLLLAASLRWARAWTRPRVALPLAGLAVLLLAYMLVDVPGASHAPFRRTLSNPDNLPVVLMLGLLSFFWWLALRRAVENDDRIARGEPTVEGAERHRKVFVWPDLVYVELIAMVLMTVVLIAWSLLVPAPLGPPAHPGRTPNPSKAPWYLVGLQDLLGYFDPWLAGVVIPSLIVVGLMAIPYLDRNPRGAGYYTLRERKGAIATFAFGFLVLWTLGIVVGALLRGPGWTLVGPFEPWESVTVASEPDVHLSEVVWLRLLGRPALPGSVWLRELPGILLVLLYMTVPPVLVARTVGRRLFRDLGAARYGVLANLALIMLAVPVKMAARWLFHLKYVVYTGDVEWLRMNL